MSNQKFSTNGLAVHHDLKLNGGVRAVPIRQSLNSTITLI